MTLKRKLDEHITYQEDVKTFENVFKSACEIDEVDDINVKQLFKKLSCDGLMKVKRNLKDYAPNTDVKMKYIMPVIVHEVKEIDTVIQKLEYARHVFHSKLVCSAKKSFPSSKRRGLIDMKKLYGFIDNLIEDKKSDNKGTMID